MISLSETRGLYKSISRSVCYGDPCERTFTASATLSIGVRLSACS